jgi:hypothetical protein
VRGLEPALRKWEAAQKAERPDCIAYETISLQMTAPQHFIAHRTILGLAIFRLKGHRLEEVI